MGKKNALILVRMAPPLEREGKWNDWYIRNRLAVPGFLSIRRFELTEGMPEGWTVLAPKYLTLYQLTDIDVLNREPYLSLRDR